MSSELAYGGGRLDVQRLQVTSRLGEVDASGTLKDGTSGQVAASWRSVDLDRVLAASGVVLPVALGSSADGRLTATLDGIARSDSDWPDRVQAEGSTRLSARGNGLSLAGTANLTLRSGSWSLPHALSSSTGRASVDGVVAGQLTPGADDSTLSRGTRLRVDDLAAIVPIPPSGWRVVAAAARRARRRPDDGRDHLERHRHASRRLSDDRRARPPGG